MIARQDPRPAGGIKCDGSGPLPSSARGCNEDARLERGISLRGINGDGSLLLDPQKYTQLLLDNIDMGNATFCGEMHSQSQKRLSRQEAHRREKPSNASLVQ